MTAPRLALAALLGAAACAPKLLPGTDLPDTADNRAIFGVVQSYRAAVERRDAAGVLALVSESYFDSAGTPDLTDDLDYATLAKSLPADLARLGSMRMDVAVTRIEVDGDRAAAFLRWDTRYRVVTRTGEVPRAQLDVSRLQLAREATGWKITAGL
jgi:ketosteroid isomerase-like protein